MRVDNMFNEAINNLIEKTREVAAVNGLVFNYVPGNPRPVYATRDLIEQINKLDWSDQFLIDRDKLIAEAMNIFVHCHYCATGTVPTTSTMEFLEFGRYV